MHFKEFALIDDSSDHFIHIVRFIGRIGNNFVERILHTIQRVIARNDRSFFEIVLRNEAKQIADQLQSVLLGIYGKMRDTRFGRMYARSAQLLGIDVFSRYGFYNSRPGKEHIRRSFCHQCKVGQCGTVYRTTSTRAENTRNLRYYARGQNIALENLGKTGQRIDTFLNTRSARVIDADTRHPHFHGKIHHFTDFLCHGLRKRTTIYSKVLCKNINKATIDRTATGNNAVAQIMFLFHPEIMAAMSYEHIDFLKTTFIEEHRDALASGIFSFLMLFGDRFLAASQTSLFAQGNQLFYFFKLVTHIFSI